MRLPLVVLLMLVFALPLPAVAQSSDEAEADDGPRVDNAFVLRPGDILSVSVLEDANLNRQLLVRPDGKISMPIAGTIDAAGKTPEQIQRIILARLARDFITPPTVDVSLSSLGLANQQRQQNDVIEEEELEAGQVFVIGQVSRPGPVPFDLEKPFDVLQALAIAGGVSPFAAVSRIQIRRRGDAGEEITLFDYELIEDGVIGEIITLEDGDVIVVPERGLFE
ncbi:MAG: polysaccharide biosynthesis/export family protein [Pseudomonadota bacterium]